MGAKELCQYETIIYNVLLQCAFVSTIYHVTKLPFFSVQTQLTGKVVPVKSHNYYIVNIKF